MDDTIAVLAPSVHVSITIEAGSESEDDIHIHAGGQGVWIARMLRQLGHRPTVCAPVGGEAGQTMLGLVDTWGIDVAAVDTSAPTPTYVHDRRLGTRVEIARSPLPELRRHEVDELYNRFLELALTAGACVVTAPAGRGQLPVDVYRRLGADLAAAGMRVVGDLHGDELAAFLDGGPMAVLKVSAKDLVADGALPSDDADDVSIAAVIDRFAGLGVETIVVSRGERPAMARIPEGYRLISGPSLAVVDAAGSGDSMTATLAAALLERRDPELALRRSWATGAVNVTRHGLGSGAVDLIDALESQATVDVWRRPRVDAD
jgi:1-phosphofructokinase